MLHHNTRMKCVYIIKYQFNNCLTKERALNCSRTYWESLITSVSKLMKEINQSGTSRIINGP